MAGADVTAAAARAPSPRSEAVGDVRGWVPRVADGQVPCLERSFAVAVSGSACGWTGSAPSSARIRPRKRRSVTLNHVRRGSGSPLLLVHGLGAGWQSWTPIIEQLAEHREVIAVDLPGFGETPPLAGEISIATLTDAVADFIREQGLDGVATVGQSMGGRMVLELARRGVGGDAVALDPGGFWAGWERAYLYTSLGASIRFVRLLRPAMPALTRSAAGRAMLLAQLSAHPTRIPADLALDEMKSFAAARSFDALLTDVAYGAQQQGAPKGSTRGPVAIGWGKKDRLCLPQQAARALTTFPGAELHWFADSGHYPHWDEPEAAARLILEKTR